MKLTPEPSQATYDFRARLWKEFVANYQVVHATPPDKFPDYCAKFRERWIAGE
jgi:hypothetical protein